MNNDTIPHLAVPEDTYRRLIVVSAALIDLADDLDMAPGDLQEHLDNTEGTDLAESMFQAHKDRLMKLDLNQDGEIQFSPEEVTVG